ncbi:MAG: hypothetical protein KDA51_07155 [Planctomycetales bacterium]|nr:hypothetical protein [Planctomycetales bacterium]MCA9181213.1 hypothetical protein [Planctomycetales bacterium]
MSAFVTLFTVPIVAILSVFLWMTIQAIVTGVRDIVKHRNEIELKQTMVDRGMSADEIERVCRATPGRPGKKC